MADVDDMVQYGKSGGERPLGDVIIRPRDRDGKDLSDPFRIFHHRKAAQEVCLATKDARDLFESTGCIVLGDNLVVNNGRQVIANLIGGKGYNSVTPSKDWVISHISFGTYDEVPRFTDQTLSPQPLQGTYVGGENEILYDGVNAKKLLSSVDWPAPFITRFEANVGADECVGYLIREMGLWTVNGTLFARKAVPALAKDDQWGFSLLWRIRT